MDAGITSTQHRPTTTLKTWLSTRCTISMQQSSYMIWILLSSRMKTSKGAASEGIMVNCTSRFGLRPKELAD
eukprot:2141075-Ditylum_brightwellii.AAC.1